MTQAELLKAAVDKQAAKATTDFCIQLGKFLDEHKICRSRLAADAYIYEANLSVILNGKGNPECDTLMKIMKAAKIEVSFKRVE